MNGPKTNPPTRVTPPRARPVQKEIAFEPAPNSEPSIGTKILSALKGPIEPVAVSPLYMLAMIPVALLMLLLPLVYVALIAGLASALDWHINENLVLFKEIPNVYGAAILYVTPIIVGVVLLFFLVKPFFARRAVSDKPFIIRREEEPLLYQYVDELCDILRAKRPAEIWIDCRVNASAGFKGILGFFTGKMVLIVGLPLVAGTDLCQFTGVLAHELGHFTQRSAMRLGYIVNFINGWFARIVLQRDKWDLKLLRASHSRSARIRLFAYLCRLLIWVTRLVLWCLLWLGVFFSAILMRRQEYNADAHEARIIGADVFEETTRRLQALSIAFQMALNELSANWREKRLADDLPMLVCTREAELSDEIRGKITEAFNSARTGRFATHPCDRDRIAAARRLNPKPILTQRLPAGHLFANFKELCRLGTIKFYQQNLGASLRPEHLYTTENVLDQTKARRETFTALQRYFQSLISPRRMFNIFAADAVPDSADGRAAIIMDARTKLCAGAEQALADARAFNEADAILDRVSKVRALVAGEIKFDPAKFNLRTGSDMELADLERQAHLVRKQASEVIDEVLAPQARRIHCALASAIVAKASVAEETYDLTPAAAASGTSAFLEALRALVLCRAQTETLRNSCRKYAALLACVRPAGNPHSLVGEIINSSHTVARELAAIHTQLRTVPYPYKHTDRGVTIARFCCPVIPPRKNHRALCNAAVATVNGLDSLYMRLMSDLAQQAEEAEKTMGLPPLPEPAKTV